MNKKLKSLSFLVVLGLVLSFLAVPGFTALANGVYDYGDAPDDALAYPSTGVIGRFPTCVGGSPGYLQLGLDEFAPYFGDKVDSEPDGNAGTCVFPPYDQDECCYTASDNDSGLRIAQAYTINATNQVVPCPGCTGTPLGSPCQMAAWGTNLDILVNAPDEPWYINVLIDWNQNGYWGGSVTCPDGTEVPEHVLVNYAVVFPYSGNLSDLPVPPPDFKIGPHNGYVWARFVISSSTVPDNWNGAGEYGEGEVEDYLLKIEGGIEGEYGDAPDYAIAYPGVTGYFPTCLGGPGGFIYHGGTSSLRLGDDRDTELDGNAGFCQPAAPCFPPYDRDECCNTASDDDSGLRITQAYTISVPAGPGSETVVPCSDCTGTPLGMPCQTAIWGTNLDLWVHNSEEHEAFVNVLMDWSRGGGWWDSSTCPGGAIAPEHVLQNFLIPGSYEGLLSEVGTVPGYSNPPDFRIGHCSGYVWSRFTITDSEIDFDPDWGWTGSGIFDKGETEDYLLEVANEPNPVLPETCGLDVVLVIDVSTSVNLTTAKQVAHTFANALMQCEQNPPTQMGVIGFSGSAYTTLDLTFDKSAVDSAIDGLGLVGGGTNWEAGIVEATKMLENDGYLNDRDDNDYPDLIIMITNGNPNTSTSDLDPLCDAVQAANRAKSSCLPIRILAAGITSPDVLERERLKAISGPKVSPDPEPIAHDTDVITNDFSIMADALVKQTLRCNSLTIFKKAVPEPDDPNTLFRIECDFAGTPIFMETYGSAGATIPDLLPGDYTLTEVLPLPPYWYLADISCTGNYELVGDSGIIIHAGCIEDIECTFTNVYSPPEELPPPPTPGGPVGITVMPMDKAGLLMPWLGLAGLLVLLSGAWLFARRRVKR